MTMIDLAKKKEPVHGRLVQYLLSNLVIDGGKLNHARDEHVSSFVCLGQWDMLVNLVNKYGVVPKSAFPESSSSESAALMNRFLRTKVILSTSVSTYSRISFRFSYVHMLRKSLKHLKKMMSKKVI